MFDPSIVPVLLKSGPWALAIVLLYFLLKSLIDKGFKLEVPPGKPKK